LAGLSLPVKSFFEDLMYGRQRSLFWEGVLSVLSCLYGAAIRVRKWGYTIHILQRRGLACTVISVGNVTLGGTGKTPAVIHLAALLLKMQRRPVVVSRGYGRTNEAERVIVSDGNSILVDTKTGGDEPVLIASKLPGVPVIVGQNRYQAAQDALHRFKTDAVILDDGFQHIQLKRTLDIVLVDARDPFGNGKLFPAGILREPIASLERADAVLITNTDRVVDAALLKESIMQCTRAPIFTSHQVPIDLIDYCSGETKPLSALHGTRVFAFSGIARPASFTSMLRSLGADIVGEASFPDHYDFKKSDLAGVFQKAADDKVSMIVTTEKDAVRLQTVKHEGVWALRIELMVTEREAWENLILKGL